LSGPLLTVGFATYDDFPGAWMTVIGLRANHPRVEILCVDSHPLGCVRTRAVVEAAGGRYHHRPNLTGTSAPRDEVFRLATTPWVACVDSHVLFAAGAVQALTDYAAAHPESADLVQGPLVYDDGGRSTHWRPTTPPGLWGVWDRDPRGGDSAGGPFEIPMLGLGMWMMRKAAWPGFSPLFRGFGGEEGYLHEVVRRRGGRCLCLPAAGWYHRFRDARFEPAPYRLSLDDHVWNLLVGHREVGVDAVEAIRADFGGRLVGSPPGAFDRLAARAAAAQPWDRPGERPPPLKVVGVWYSNNAAPVELLTASLGSIKRAADLSRADVRVVTCPWRPIPGNPFPETLADSPSGPGHLNIVRQQRQCLNAVRDGWVWRDKSQAWDAGGDVVCFLEHDVLYPPDYFDRVARAFRENPGARVVSNQDYEGLNATGWLRVKDRHEPLHQLSLRYDVALENLDRAEADCGRQGWAYLEPDHDGGRADWVRIPPAGVMPAVHVNHTAGRLTSHGEAVYEAVSSVGPVHRFWGDAAAFWPHPPAALPPAAPAACEPCQPGHAGPPAIPRTIAELYADAAARPSDFAAHVATLKELADQCGAVAEVSIWDDKPALVALAASSADVVLSVSPRPKRLWAAVRAARPDLKTAAGDAGVRAGVDLLFWDGNHRAEDVYAALLAYAPHVTRYLVVHCTTDPYGETGDDGGPGVMPAVRRFLNEHREWTAVRHDPHGHGLLVMSRDDRDKKREPGWIAKAMNFSKAKIRHLANGSPVVSDRVFALRMAECVVCPERTGDVCAACGCPVDAKAAWATEQCGLATKGLEPKWTAVSAAGDVE